MKDKPPTRYDVYIWTGVGYMMLETDMSHDEANEMVEWMEEDGNALEIREVEA